MLFRVLKSQVLLLALIPSIALVAAVACADEAEEPAAPLAAQAAAAPQAPEASAGAPGAPKAAQAADAPLPAQAAADPEAPKAASKPAAVRKKIETRTGPTGPVIDLHDSQVVTSAMTYVGGVVPWKNSGPATWVWSTHVFGTLYQNDRVGNVIPYIALSHTANDDQTVFTFKLREGAVFQDGTPITAGDIKAYWEHGAKPENIVAWGGASLTLGEIKGWDELRAGDVTEAEGLVAIDDHTLEMTMSIPFAAWPSYVSAWHAGLSKLAQVLADPDNDEWVKRPIGAGPYTLTKDLDTGLIELTRADLAGDQWWGDTPIIEKYVQLSVPDRQVQLIMFENQELDFLQIDPPTHEKVLNPDNPLNPLLMETPFGGIWYIKLKTDLAPLEDLLVRKSLAHATDMRTIVKAVWGSTENYATGMTSPSIPCHNPDAKQHAYDPGLAVQELGSSTYASADNLPPLIMDLARPLMINAGVAIKEYWKDNLGVELDLLKRERGMPRRPGAQFYRISVESWVPDPVLIISMLTRTDSIEALTPQAGGYPVIDSLLTYARSLPLGHPDRCVAFQAIEEEYMDKVYMIPVKWKNPFPWLVQPWLKGFDGSYNFDFSTLPTAYLVKH